MNDMGEKETAGNATRARNQVALDDDLNSRRGTPEANPPRADPEPEPAEGAVVKSKSNITNN